MIYVTLDEVKDQVSIERARDDLDAKLTRLAIAAETWASNFLNAPLADFEESPIQSPPVLPEDLKSGILLHVQWEFEQNDKTMDTLLKRAQDLLWPYRTGLGV